MAVAPANRLQTLRSLRNANADMACALAFITLTTGSFQVGFVKFLGGGDLWIGLLAAIPSLLGIVQIPGAIWGRSFASFKPFIRPGGWAWRILHAPLILLPLVALSPDVKLAVLAICMVLAAGAVFVVQAIHSDWLAEMVPPNSRGAFFARRNAIGAAVGAVVGLGGGFLLDVFRRNDQEAVGFTVIFGVGLLFGLISMFFFERMEDIPRPSPVKQNLREGILAIGAPFGDRSFRRVLVFLGLFVFSQAFAGNLWGAYAIEELKLPFTAIQAFAVTHALGNVLASGLWGFLSDRFGNKPLLFVAGIGLSTTPTAWLFTQPGMTGLNIAILLPSHIFMGVVWSAVGLTQFNLVLATADVRDRANYIGAAMALQALVGGAAPLVGAVVMASFRATLDPTTAYKTVFGLVMGMRFLSTFLLLPVKEEGAAKLGHAVRQMARVRPKSLGLVRSLARSTDAASREAAIVQAGETASGLATDEIIKALHDPQPSVRRSAAAALAQIGDPRAAQGLRHMLQDHPDLVDEEILEALGGLGDTESVPLLLRYLQSPSGLVRRSAARALARIGDERAVPDLMEAASREGDVDLRRGALQALRMMGVREAGSIYAAAVLDPHPSVRIAASEAIAELEVREAAPNLRQGIGQFDDEATAEMAYALGAVGDSNDLPAVLLIAQRSGSMITRRRALLGVARRLRVESAVYRLMLLDGMARDGALEALAGKGGSPRLRVALERFSRGDEEGAVAAAATLAADLAPLMETPVEEAFLVAVCYLVR